MTGSLFPFLRCLAHHKEQNVLLQSMLLTCQLLPVQACLHGICIATAAAARAIYGLRALDDTLTQQCTLLMTASVCDTSPHVSLFHSITYKIMFIPRPNLQYWQCVLQHCASECLMQCRPTPNPLYPKTQSAALAMDLGASECLMECRPTPNPRSFHDLICFAGNGPYSSAHPSAWCSAGRW